MGIRFKRSELYEEVWSTPITTLAKKYSLSDGGLRRICKTMHIPLTIAGHWAKAAAGHAVRKMPLPAFGGRMEFWSEPRRSVALRGLPQKASASVLENEQDTANRMVVPITLENPHRLVALAERFFRGHWEKKREAEQATARYRAANARGIRQSPNVAALQLHEFQRHAGITTAPSGGLKLAASEATFARVLRIADTFIKSSIKRGFPIDTRVPSALRVNGALVNWQIRERIRFVERGEPPKEADALTRLTWTKRQEQSSGELTLRLDVGTSSIELKESQTNRLEDRLNEAFVAMDLTIAKERVRERQRQTERDAHEESEARRLAVQRIREAEQKQHSVEMARREQLLLETRRWRQAQMLRDYIDAVESRARRQLGDQALTSDELWGWICWASTVADELDPTVTHMPALPPRMAEH